MNRVVFFLEEPSAKALLESLLPRYFPGRPFLFIVFQGKQQLDRDLPKRLRGWNVPGDRFVVLRDQDDDDCHDLKRRLTDLCRVGQQPDTIVRIACRELEAWYFGDLPATARALHAPELAALAGKARFRHPDQIVRPSDALAESSGCRYQKIDGSRRIGKHLTPKSNQSPSFGTFWQTLEQLADPAT